MIGLFGKYEIKKSDGSHIDPDAQYFVLRLDTDEAARHAMLSYARRCNDERLFVDIIGWILRIDPEFFSDPCGPSLMAFEKEIIAKHIT